MDAYMYTINALTANKWPNFLNKPQNCTLLAMFGVE